MVPPCITLSDIRYVSREKWSNPGKGVAPSSTPRCRSYWKGRLQVALDYGRQLYFYYTYIYIVIHRQTVSLYHNSLVCLDTRDALSWDRKPPNFKQDLLSNLSAILVTYIDLFIFIQSVEAKYRILFKRFFSLIRPILEKKTYINLYFHD